MIPIIDPKQYITQEVELPVREYSIDATSYAEQLIIMNLIRIINPRIIFEFGTCMGRTAINMAANSNAKIYTLDLKPDPIIGSLFKGSNYNERIEQLYLDSLDYNCGGLHGSVDFIFVDGAHDYLHCITDSRNAVRMLRPRAGMVVWHDYVGSNGVDRAVHEMFWDYPSMFHFYQNSELEPEVPGAPPIDFVSLVVYDRSKDAASH
jgi:predicted O-methyltransferase YrrM